MIELNNEMIIAEVVFLLTGIGTIAKMCHANLTSH